MTFYPKLGLLLFSFNGKGIDEDNWTSQHALMRPLLSLVSQNWRRELLFWNEKNSSFRNLAKLNKRSSPASTPKLMPPLHIARHTLINWPKYKSTLLWLKPS
jgi:hypothetical protein